MTRVAAAMVAIVAALQPMTYRNTELSAEQRADDLLSRMTLDEKVGQMAQADSGALRAGDVARLRLGSVLSGGSSEAPDITARGWRAFVDAFQKEALTTRLGIPILYGIDAVHGHNNFAARRSFRTTSASAPRAIRS